MNPAVHVDWHGTCCPFGVRAGLDTLGRDLEQYLDLLSVRQKLTASNIANADTPGYKTRDIDFQTELATALREERSSPRAFEVRGLAVRNDGNNVSIDREARSLAETALRFRVGSQMLKHDIEMARKAIQSGG